MSEELWAMLTVFGLGIVYFLAAIPTGVALHLNPVIAALSAWAGYTTIAAAMLVIGTPARKWLESKFKISRSSESREALLARLGPLGTARSRLACAGHLRSLLRCAHRPCAWRKACAPPAMDRRRRDSVVRPLRSARRRRRTPARGNAEMRRGSDISGREFIPTKQRSAKP